MSAAQLTGVFLDGIGGHKYKMAAPIPGPHADGKMEARVLLEVTCPMASLSPTAGWGWAFTLGRQVRMKKSGLHLGAPRAGPSRRCFGLMIPRCTSVRDYPSKRFRELYGMGIPSAFKLTHVDKDFFLS